MTSEKILTPNGVRKLYNLQVKPEINLQVLYANMWKNSLFLRVADNREISPVIYLEKVIEEILIGDIINIAEISWLHSSGNKEFHPFLENGLPHLVIKDYKLLHVDNAGHEILFNNKNWTYQDSISVVKDAVSKSMSKYFEKTKLNKIEKYILEAKTEAKDADSNDLRIKGNKFYEQKDYAKAIECYDKAKSLSFYERKIWCNSSLTYICMKEYENALRDAFIILKYDPFVAKGYHRASIALRSLKDYETLFKILRAAILLSDSLTEWPKLLSNSREELFKEVIPTIGHKPNLGDIIAIILLASIEGKHKKRLITIKIEQDKLNMQSPNTYKSISESIGVGQSITEKWLQPRPFGLSNYMKDIYLSRLEPLVETVSQYLTDANKALYKREYEALNGAMLLMIQRSSIMPTEKHAMKFIMKVSAKLITDSHYFQPKEFPEESVEILKLVRLLLGWLLDHCFITTSKIMNYNKPDCVVGARNDDPPCILCDVFDREKEFFDKIEDCIQYSDKDETISSVEDDEEDESSIESENTMKTNIIAINDFPALQTKPNKKKNMEIQNKSKKVGSQNNDNGKKKIENRNNNGREKKIESQNNIDKKNLENNDKNKAKEPKKILCGYHKCQSSKATQCEIECLSGCHMKFHSMCWNAEKKLHNIKNISSSNISSIFCLKPSCNAKVSKVTTIDPETQHKEEITALKIDKPTKKRNKKKNRKGANNNNNNNNEKTTLQESKRNDYDDDDNDSNECLNNIETASNTTDSSYATENGAWGVTGHDQRRNNDAGRNNYNDSKAYENKNFSINSDEDLELGYNPRQRSTSPSIISSKEFLSKDQFDAIMTFMRDYIQQIGPVLLDDKRIIDYVQDTFPKNALDYLKNGNIIEFLTKSEYFYVVDNFIYLESSRETVQDVVIDHILDKFNNSKFLLSDGISGVQNSNSILYSTLKEKIDTSSPIFQESAPIEKIPIGTKPDYSHITKSKAPTLANKLNQLDYFDDSDKSISVIAPLPVNKIKPMEPVKVSKNILKEREEIASYKREIEELKLENEKMRESLENNKIQNEEEIESLNQQLQTLHKNLSSSQAQSNHFREEYSKLKQISDNERNELQHTLTEKEVIIKDLTQKDEDINKEIKNIQIDSLYKQEEILLQILNREKNNRVEEINFLSSLDPRKYEADIIQLHKMYQEISKEEDKLRRSTQDKILAVTSKLPCEMSVKANFISKSILKIISREFNSKTLSNSIEQKNQLDMVQEKQNSLFHNTSPYDTGFANSYEIWKPKPISSMDARKLVKPIPKAGTSISLSNPVHTYGQSMSSGYATNSLSGFGNNSLSSSAFGLPNSSLLKNSFTPQGTVNADRQNTILSNQTDARGGFGSSLAGNNLISDIPLPNQSNAQSNQQPYSLFGQKILCEADKLSIYNGYSSMHGNLFSKKEIEEELQKLIQGNAFLINYLKPDNQDYILAILHTKLKEKIPAAKQAWAGTGTSDSRSRHIDKPQTSAWSTTSCSPVPRDCSICLNILEDNVAVSTLRCRHKFHKKCISEWNNKSNVCPICRTSIVYRVS